MYVDEKRSYIILWSCWKHDMLANTNFEFHEYKFLITKNKKSYVLTL